jgi:hypothetical protein
MTGKVVPLGGVQLSPAEPLVAIVEMLETMLAQAKRGEIIAIAVAYVDAGHTTYSQQNGGTAFDAMLVGGVARLLHRIAAP